MTTPFLTFSLPNTQAQWFAEFCTELGLVARHLDVDRVAIQATRADCVAAWELWVQDVDRVLKKE